MRQGLVELTTVLPTRQALQGQLNLLQGGPRVGDPEGLAASVVSFGGAVVNRSEPDDRLVIGIADPEGNTMELVAQ